jgi:hypothetical protein
VLGAYAHVPALDGHHDRRLVDVVHGGRVELVGPLGKDVNLVGRLGPVDSGGGGNGGQ